MDGAFKQQIPVNPYMCVVTRLIRLTQVELFYNEVLVGKSETMELFRVCSVVT